MINRDRLIVANALSEVLDLEVTIVPPNPLRPPLAWLNEGEPFLEKGAAYGDTDMSLSLTLLAPVSADQEEQLKALDVYLDKLQDSTVWEWVRTVSGYQALSGPDQQQYLATEISLIVTIVKDKDNGHRAE